jgi:hypothetical protein
MLFRMGANPQPFSLALKNRASGHIHRYTALVNRTRLLFQKTVAAGTFSEQF